MATPTTPEGIAALDKLLTADAIKAMIALQNMLLRETVFARLAKGPATAGDIRKEFFPEFQPAHRRTAFGNRLREMERDGIIERAGTRPPDGAVIFRLTASAYKLAEIDRYDRALAAGRPFP